MIDNKERRARLGCFVLELFPNILRFSVSHYMIKKGLSNKYCNNIRCPSVFTTTELLLIQELPNVDNFTIQLCYKLITFEELLPTPSKGWGKFPDSNAIKVEDDIERMRHGINEIITVTWVNDDHFTECYFDKFLNELEQIIQRLQVALGNTNVYTTYKSVLIKNIDAAVILAELRNVDVIDSDVTLIKLQDRERYSKISAVITEFFPKILRIHIPEWESPLNVYKKCNQKGRQWNKTQTVLIDTLKDNENFESLDVSMLYQLFKQLSFVPDPTQKWGEQPRESDKCTTDDIVRIYRLRNKCAHRSDTCIDQLTFDNYFGQFRDITHRIASDYEHELSAISRDSLDPNRQKELEEALQKLEDIKEQFQRTPMRFFWGNDMALLIKDIRQRINREKDILGQEKFLIEIELMNIDDAETKAKILNKARSQINEIDLNIEFLGAFTGSLVLYAYISRETLATDDILQTELSSFMTRILKKGNFEMISTKLIDAVIFPSEGNKELELNSSTSKSLKLQFKVKKNVFETDVSLDSEIGACMQQIMKPLEGKGLNEEVTAILHYVEFDTVEAHAMEPCQPIPVDTIVEIKKVETVVSTIIEQEDTEEAHSMETSQSIPVDTINEIKKEENAVCAIIEQEDTEEAHSMETSQSIPVDTINEIKKEENVVCAIIEQEDTKEAHSMETSQSIPVDTLNEIKKEETFVSAIIEQEDTKEAHSIETSQSIPVDTLNEILKEETVVSAIIEQVPDRAGNQTGKRPVKRTLPLDLQGNVGKLQKKRPTITVQPDNVYEGKQRWLIVGICYNCIISPMLRDYIEPIVYKLYMSLVSKYSIDKQEYPGCLKRNSATGKYFLNYESINNNRNIPKTKINNKWICDFQKYDYKVTSHVDLSKLFLLPSLAHYSVIDESCESSALLGMVINISSFPSTVQLYAEKIRKELHNRLANCDFKEWTMAKYTDSFNLMAQFVQELRLSNKEENRILGELNTWTTKGLHFLSGLEVVDEHTHILSESVTTLSKKTDSQLMRVHSSLPEGINNVERKTMKHEEQLENLKEEMINQEKDYIPKHIIDQHVHEIREWEHEQSSFLKTNGTRHILGALPLNNCIVVTGSSGCGKSSNIHHAALDLRDRFGYEIIPVLTGPIDIMNYYNINKPQVFVVDDICGKETINRKTLQTWRDSSDKIMKIFRLAEKYVANKNDETRSKVSCPKLLISCRLHIYNDSQFEAFPLLRQKECNLLSPELCLQKAERVLMLQKYLPGEIIDNLAKVTDNVDYFPLLCKLSKDKTSEEVNQLFTAPTNSIKSNIKNIIYGNKNQCCALALCILFDGGFDTDWLKLRSPSELKDKIEDIVKIFQINIDKEIDRQHLKSGFATLSCTYLKVRGTKYMMIDDNIYKIAALVFGQNITECLIKHVSSEFIRDRFIFDSSKTSENDDSIVLMKHQEEVYFERLLSDLKAFDITSTFHNKQLKSKLFIEKLIRFFERSDSVKLLKKIDIEGVKVKNDHEVDRHFEQNMSTTLLIEAASGGYDHIVKFLIVDVKCDVNRTDGVQRSPLYKASERGHSSTVKLLLENNADVSQRNQYGMSPLFVACQMGHTNTVEMLLQDNDAVHQCKNNGESIVYEACKGGYKDIVELLIRNKADVSQCSYLERSPLYVASEGGHTDIANMLLLNAADVCQCTRSGESPLYAASEGGHRDIVELLLKNTANTSQCNKDGKSPLYIACEAGHTDIVKLFLQKNPDVSQCYYNGEHLLYTASKRGHTDIVDMLIKEECDVSLFPDYGKSPLYVACEGGHTETVQLLLRNNADVSQCNASKESPLYVACKGGHTGTVQLLLRNNADVSQCNASNESPLYVACKGGYTETVQLLLKKKADVYQCYTYQESPLYVACEGGHTETVQLLLRNNADVSQCNASKESPLYVACKGGHTGTVQLLLRNNADVSQCNASNESPLYVACKGGYTETVQLLLKKKADVYQCNTYQESPLYVACEGGHTETVQLLLLNNADLSQCNTINEYPLYVACEGGHTETVKLLLRNNADVSQCNASNESPLDVACEGGHREIVQLLLLNKADVSQCNASNESPLDVAGEGGHTETVQLLLRNKADVSQCNASNESPLDVAGEGGHTETVQLLLRNKADVSQCNASNESLLDVAGEGGHTETVQLLLRNKADVSQCNASNESPLDVVCEGGHTETVQLIARNKADVSQCGTYEESPLYVACEGEHTETVQLPFRNKADVSQSYTYRESPLYVACSKDNIIIRKMLRKRNADVDQCETEHGQSPLHMVCNTNILSLVLNVHQINYKINYTAKIETVKFLLAWNAKDEMCYKKGQTPLDIARKSTFLEIKNVLERSLKLKVLKLM